MTYEENVLDSVGIVAAFVHCTHLARPLLPHEEYKDADNG